MEEKLYWGLGPSLGPFSDVCSELGTLGCMLCKIIFAALL